MRIIIDIDDKLVKDFEEMDEEDSDDALGYIQDKFGTIGCMVFEDKKKVFNIKTFEEDEDITNDN